MGMDIFSILTGAPQTNNAVIPGRDPGAQTGSAFGQSNMQISGSVREGHILDEFMAGNIPDFLRHFLGIKITSGSNYITYLVMPDYLSIGNNEDYIRMPMNPHTAQTIANKYDCTLPTKKMVDDIWKAATNKLQPLPWGPPYDATMLHTDRIVIHNGRVQQQLVNKDFKALTAGHKKDVVLTNRLSLNNPNKRVAIYGWMLSNGQAIQGLNPTSHEDTYADYSHGIRLVSNDVFVNGTLMRMSEVFANANFAPLVSDEGILTFTKY